MRWATVLLAVSASGPLAACGGSDRGSGSATSGAVTSGASVSSGAVTSGAAAVKALPAVPLTDVASGKASSLADLIPADRPTLVWAWAPH